MDFSYTYYVCVTVTISGLLQARYLIRSENCHYVFTDKRKRWKMKLNMDLHNIDVQPEEQFKIILLKTLLLVTYLLMKGFPLKVYHFDK